ncbi:MAG: septum formation inhibitor Maf [Clostridia bacterium]|nr:septum formation inhibitor Maf [Clostridia bacterium]
MNTQLPIVLASGSPRRKEILETMGLSYTVDVSDVDESFSGAPEETVMELSRRKAYAVSARHPDSIIVAADTIVYDNEILGKPGTQEAAAAMLRSLSGKWHSVYTGITIINTKTGKMLSRAEETRVHFDALTEQEILRYVRTNDSLDKAGAYGIQGMAGMYIDRIEGSYSNVVGLPMSLLRNMLKDVLNPD